jgi:hypothetical protein
MKPFCVQNGKTKCFTVHPKTLCKKTKYRDAESLKQLVNVVVNALKVVKPATS